MVDQIARAADTPRPTPRKPANLPLYGRTMSLLTRPTGDAATATRHLPPQRARRIGLAALSVNLVERETRCGNTGCRCHADPPQLHGPYLTWTRKVGNKTVTRTLDTTQADAIRPLLNNSRRLRELTTELETLALQQVKDDQTQPDP